MKEFTQTTLACRIAALMVCAAGVAHAEERPVVSGMIDAVPKAPLKITPPKSVRHAAPVIPSAEPAGITGVQNAGFNTSSAFTSAAVVSPSTTGTTLTPPVTLSYAGNSPVLSIADTGTNRGVSVVISNTHNPVSALYGQTNGSGAGLTGYNYGTVGPAAKFAVSNSSSAQAAVFASTNGYGPAVLGTITAADSDYPAIFGQNNSTSYYGIGVEGIGNSIGVYGSTSTGTALYGISSSGTGSYAYSDTGYGMSANSSSSIGLFASSYSSYGLYAESSTGDGVYSYSGSDYGVYAVSGSGTGIYGASDGGNHGITAYSASGIGLYSSSGTGYGIWGQSTNTYGVIGEDSGTGIGVYGYSASGYAGYFSGKVGATSFVTTSDRNVKTNIRAIDAKDILARIDHLPITTWEFKTDLSKHHVGPMAQDFHAAFGLDGDDDKHINLTDIAGISLAAIKQLSADMKDKDAQIADLRKELSAQARTVADLKSMNEAVLAQVSLLVHPHDAVVQTTSLRTQSGLATGRTAD